MTPLAYASSLLLRNWKVVALCAALATSSGISYYKGRQACQTTVTVPHLVKELDRAGRKAEESVASAERVVNRLNQVTLENRLREQELEEVGNRSMCSFSSDELRLIREAVEATGD